LALHHQARLGGLDYRRQIPDPGCGTVRLTVCELKTEACNSSKLRLRRVRIIFMPKFAACALFLALAGVTADEPMKVEVLKEGPPGAVHTAIRGVLNTRGYRVLGEGGRPLVEIWLRKTIPASDKPAGAKGTIQFPFLASGEVLGVCQYLSEGRDYRDQEIAKGCYTLRYGLQPVNGDHLGVSPFRDYALLLPAAKDHALALLPRKQLEEKSAESAGTSHPAVLMLLSAPAEGLKNSPTMVHDSDPDKWSVSLPLDLLVKGRDQPLAFPVRLVVVGVGPT
jgi:hypothetical protein